MTLTPSYGRDYKTAKEALADFHEGKDFKIASVGPYMGAYCSKRDLKGKEVKIRFDGNSQFVMVKVA